ncbi:MAG: DUF4129 domain-containing protein [Fimbriimonadales bacterium]
MKHWRKTSGARISRVASSFSLFVLAALAFGGPYGDLGAQLRGAQTTQQKVQILNESKIDDKEFSTYVERADATDPKSVQAAVDFVGLKEIAESAGTPTPQSGQIKRIKSSALYRDEGQKESANWLSGAIERMKNMRLSLNPPRVSGPSVNPMGAAPILIWAVWILLGAAVLAFIVYALRFVSFGKLKKRRARAMLEDDEPERTLDEWLALAESLEREARYREAVRALYLACLLKFDERNVARFVRSQTNWEHLARIESSPRRPSGLDFRTPTQAFDRIWYGHKVRGADDVDDFKSWYRRVSAAFQEAAA